MDVNEETHEKLLQFLYQVPIGIIEIDSTGEVGLMNPSATQTLLAMDATSSLNNLFCILDTYDTSISEAVTNFKPKFGPVLVEYPLTIGKEESEQTHYWININRLNVSTFSVILKDVTEFVIREKQIIQAVEGRAVERGKAEIASGMLHDIGNAVTGLSSSISKQLADSRWPELDQLELLRKFVESENDSLGQAIGPEKSKALANFVNELGKQLDDRQMEAKSRAKSMSANIAHIAEILSIHRKYGNTRHSQERETYHIVDLIEDALELQTASFEKRNIRIERLYPPNIPQLRLDRTQIIQVIMNLIKNALESYDEKKNRTTSVFKINIQFDEHHVQVIFNDDAMGFDSEKAESFFQNAVSTKKHGTGMGLFQSRAIARAHAGDIYIASDGKGLGACSVLKLPIKEQ